MHAEREIEPLRLPGAGVNATGLALATLDWNGDGVEDLAVLRHRPDGAGAASPELVVKLGNPRAVYAHYPAMRGADLPDGPFLADRGPYQLADSLSDLPAERLVVADADGDTVEDLLVLGPDFEILGFVAGELGANYRTGKKAGELLPFSPSRLEDPRLRRALDTARLEPGDIAEMRLGAHAGGDLAFIDDRGELYFSPRPLLAVITVNSTLDAGDAFLGDGLCDTANNPTSDPPTPPSGLCTLRAALETANGGGGADTINFSIGGGGAQLIEVGAVLEILGPATLDATTQPGFAGAPLIELRFAGGGIFPGLSVQAASTLIRGFVIGGFTTEGIAVFEDDVTIETCYVGTQADGTTARQNFRGIGVSGDGVRIGGTMAGTGNLVSGNFDGGITTTGDHGEIFGNLVGTDVTGTASLDNGIAGRGIRVQGMMNEVGSIVGDGGNLISGGASIGLWLQGSANVVSGNKVGTTLDGDVALPNFFAGVYVQADDDAYIADNLISGNNGDGLLIAGSQRVKVERNTIGLDITKSAALGNTGHGVRLVKDGTTAATLTEIGGPLGGFIPRGNVISANGQHGVYIHQETTETRVEGNVIGTGTNGLANLGNGGDGVHIEESTFSFIGATPGMTGVSNLIAYNGGAGIGITDLNGAGGTQNTEGHEITANELRQNGGLGIDLSLGGAALDGVTPNDAGDGDVGGNQLQNFPLITDLSQPSPGIWRIEGTLSSRPSRTYAVRLYSNEQCDASLHGEAETYITSALVFTDGAGEADFNVDSTLQVDLVTATATDLSTGDTSELSPCFSPAGGRLGNRVWVDLDLDGLQGIDDPGLEAVVVELLNGAGTTVLDATLTDAGGFYGFSGLATGTYRIRVTPPAAYSPTEQDIGIDDSIDSDIGPGFLTDAFSYTSGTVDLSRDAGLSSLIFTDGFESGDISRWSSSVGN